MEVKKYEDSGIAPEILRAVADMGFENMTPIQEQAIPVLLEGKDIIGQAQTGTGKTAAFGIPVIQSIDTANRNVQAIVLCPTRELAMQAADDMHHFAKYTHGIKILPIYGGQEIYKQIKALKAGVQIIVGTPGRVMDHMRRHTIKMEHIRMVVLDEADEMLNMGFREDMETILKEIPTDHQTALFSATMPKPILDITSMYQKEDAVMVKIVKEELTIPLVEQLYYQVRSQYKEEAVGRLLEYYAIKRSLIFCNTKRMVDELAEKLKQRGFSAEGLHGDMSQHQRDVTMNRFRSGNLEVLIATDVAARGIDVDDVEAVFNYDIPQDIEYYVHRIGRTGRAGKEGKAFTFVSGREMYKLRDIERICKTKMKEQSIPSVSAVTSIKAEKILAEALAVKTTDKEKEKLLTTLNKAMLDNEMSATDMAMALLKLHMGEETPEIEIFAEPTRKYDRDRKGGNRSGGNREGGSREGGNRNYRGGSKDGENRGYRGGQGKGKTGEFSRSDTGRSGFRKERSGDSAYKGKRSFDDKKSGKVDVRLDGSVKGEYRRNKAANK